MSLTSAAVHFLEDLGLVVAVGSITVRRLGGITPRIAWVEPPLAGALGLAALGGAGGLLLEHSWLVGLRVAAEVTAWILCLRGFPYVAPVAVAAAALLSLTGHATRLTYPAGAEFADALHVLSAGMWAGGIVATAYLQPPEGWSSREAQALLERFGRIAVIAFGVTALTGLLRATEQLSSVSDLWTTPYGVVLALKMAGVVLMLAFGALWRRGLPIGRQDAAIAILVVLATGVLSALPVNAR